MEELLYNMNPWWEEKFISPGIKRKKYLKIMDEHLERKDIVFLTGLRRIGKTTLLKQFINELIEKKVNQKNICYLSLDSYAFSNLSIHDLVRKFRQIGNIGVKEKIYLFFDEVTHKKSYNQELKNLYDNENCKIYASSSSASLLKDKNAFLTGRTKLIEIEPLDFKEFCLFNSYSFKAADKHLIENAFMEYMQIGGIPEYVLTKDPEYITNLVDNIISKDIISANGIKNISIIKDLFKLLCERVGKQLSYNKIGRILGVTNDSIRNYIKLFEDTYLFFIVEKEGKLNERIKSDKKLYCADVGIKNVSTGVRDLGAIYENLVFLKLKKENPRYIRKDNIEIDFYYKDNLIEAKFGQKLSNKQQEVFNSIKAKNKIVTNGVDFFMD